MLRRFAFGFAGILAAAVAVSACSSNDATQTISVGPNFAAGTLYLTNPTQDALEIYPPTPANGAGPQYDLTSSGNLTGPQSVAFDSALNVYVANWNASTNAGSIAEFKTYATGGVIPVNAVSMTQRPRGMVGYSFTFAGASTPTDVLAIAAVDPTQPSAFSNQIRFYQASLLSEYETLAGPLTNLNVPDGIAVDSKANVYVTNLQGRSVEEFTLPSPTPTASPTATPTASPTPSPTPSGATPSPSPTPVPTPTPVNIAPVATLTTDIGQPTGIALDSSGKIYVSDLASPVCAPACPAILIFPAGSNGAVTPAYIAGSKTTLFSPTDVKVDASGNIYVADTKSSGAGVIDVFAPGATGNVAPTATYTSPGSALGLGLLP
jgi:hypothetical protein